MYLRRVGGRRACCLFAGSQQAVSQDLKDGEGLGEVHPSPDIIPFTDTTEEKKAANRLPFVLN